MYQLLKCLAVKLLILHTSAFDLFENKSQGASLINKS